MKQQSKITDIDAYVASASPQVREILERIREVVRVAVPEATETISYQMPAFKLERVFFYFAAFKKHIGIYPPVKGDRELQNELLPCRGDKGNLKFPLGESIPYELIGRVASALSQEYSRQRANLGPARGDRPVNRLFIGIKMSP
jgi:uncharacterized protein YdhG (YjbR/CyaY superfamily)